MSGIDLLGFKIMGGYSLSVFVQRVFQMVIVIFYLQAGGYYCIESSLSVSLQNLSTPDPCTMNAKKMLMRVRSKLSAQ